MEGRSCDQLIVGKVAFHEQETTEEVKRETTQQKADFDSENQEDQDRSLRSPGLTSASIVKSRKKCKGCLAAGRARGDRKHRGGCRLIPIYGNQYD